MLTDADARIRASACQAAGSNWDSAFAPRLVQLLSDQDPAVCWAACNCLQAHPAESTNHLTTYEEMVAEGGATALPAMKLLMLPHVEVPKAALVPLMASPEYCTARTAEWLLRDRKLDLDEISPLLTNSLPRARYQGLVALIRLGDKLAIDRMVSMLRDPHEGLRWIVRTNLRRLSGEKLGADPAAWEKWWAENRETFTPAPPRRTANN